MLTDREKQALLIILLVICAGSMLSFFPQLSRDRRPASYQKKQWTEQHPKPLINVNTASIEQLAALPGIGLTIAKNIVNYRQKHGPFMRWEDVRKVKGVTRRVWRQCAFYLTTESHT